MQIRPIVPLADVARSFPPRILEARLLFVADAINSHARCASSLNMEVFALQTRSYWQ